MRSSRCLFYICLFAQLFRNVKQIPDLPIDPCFIRPLFDKGFFKKKIKAFFWRIRVFLYILYKNFLGTPCTVPTAWRKGESNQQCACAELQLDCFFQKAVQKCMNSHVHASLFFFQKAVQKCMNSHVHVSFLFF